MRYLAPALQDLLLPAQARQVLTHAELYGTDASTRTTPRPLSAGRYPTVRAVAETLTSTRPTADVDAGHTRVQSMAPDARRRR